MISLLAGVTAVLLTASLPGNVSITGGTPDERKKVQAALRGIPDCLFRFDEDPLEIRVVRSTAVNATYDPATGAIAVLSPLVNETELPAAKTEMALHRCTTPSSLDDFSRADRVLLHEIAHRYHLGSFKNDLKNLPPIGARTTGSSSNPTIGKFLDLRFRTLSDTWHENEVRAELIRVLKLLHDGVQQLREAKRPIPPVLLERMCELEELLQGEYEKEFGMPARFANDRHAFDERSGTEYFAMAIETLVYDHALFCKVYTQAERDWLAAELGECLLQLPHRAPCFHPPQTRKQPPKNTGGGRFLTP